jgi:hypothetical protein
MNTNLRIQDVRWRGLHPTRMSAITSVFFTENTYVH